MKCGCSQWWWLGDIHKQQLELTEFGDGVGDGVGDGGRDGDGDGLGTLGTGLGTGLGIPSPLLDGVHVGPENIPVVVRALAPALPPAPLEVSRHHELIKVAPPRQRLVALAMPTARRHRALSLVRSGMRGGGVAPGCDLQGAHFEFPFPKKVHPDTRFESVGSFSSDSKRYAPASVTA